MILNDCVTYTFVNLHYLTLLHAVKVCMKYDLVS